MRNCQEEMKINKLRSKGGKKRNEECKKSIKLWRKWQETDAIL